MEIEEDQQHYQFTLDILKALHLESTSFFDDLMNDAPYEVQVYKWIDKLYKQNKSIDEAIELIHRVRRFFIL
jgi:hypothetical protein